MLSRSLAMTALCSALKPRSGPDGRSSTYGRSGVDVGTAVQQPRRRRQLTGVHSVLEGLVENLLLPARGGIESKHQIQGRRCVEHTVDDEGHRLVVLPRVTAYRAASSKSFETQRQARVSSSILPRWT